MRYKSMCLKCAHFYEDPETGEPMCESFQGPIPEEIWVDGFDHRQPYPGDNGMTFTPSGPVDVKWLEQFDNSGTEGGVVA